jgi:hypothetical protein
MNELMPTSIVALFETSKTERQSFVSVLVDAVESGAVDPLKIHLQIKCMEDIVKLLNSNTIYKSQVLDAAEKNGKSFEFHSAKFEVKETGVKYDYSQCGDEEYNSLQTEMEALSLKIKDREKFLKTVPTKGMALVIEGTGEVATVYPPSKSSTTSVAVTLK